MFNHFDFKGGADSMVENKWSQTVVYSPKLPLLQPPPLHNSVMRRVPKDEIAREMNAPLVVIMVVAGAVDVANGVPH
jgi:hypothetical protein